MTKEIKTHYRKVFKSDHLGSADIEEYIEEGKSTVFTIKKVIQYEIDPKIKDSGVVVAGRRISANIAFFSDKGVKPMVINARNSKPIIAITGSKFVEDWKDLLVEIYVDPHVKFSGETVGGIRIRNKQLSNEDLSALYELKKDSIPSEHVVNAQRIIDEKESNSYNKLHKYLTSL